MHVTNRIFLARIHTHIYAHTHTQKHTRIQTHKHSQPYLLNYFSISRRYGINHMAYFSIRINHMVNFAYPNAEVAWSVWRLNKIRSVAVFEPVFQPEETYH